MKFFQINTEDREEIGAHTEYANFEFVISNVKTLRNGEDSYYGINFVPDVTGRFDSEGRSNFSILRKEANFIYKGDL